VEKPTAKSVHGKKIGSRACGLYFSRKKEKKKRRKEAIKLVDKRKAKPHTPNSSARPCGLRRSEKEGESHMRRESEMAN